MNKNTFTLAVLLLLSFANALAQQVKISGKITDAANGAPLISATVSAGETGAITDLDGAYELELPAGEYEVKFSFVGYESLVERVQLKAGTPLSLDIRLTESANLLQTATVTAGKHERALGEVTVSLDVIRPSLLENTNQTSLTGLLDKVPGVNMVGDQANIRGGSGFSYGAGSRVLLLVDDMPILQADAGFPQWEDVPIENIEQIEVVKGAASALYGSSALNGIINVRTAYAKGKPETKFSPFYSHFFDPKNENLKWWDKPPYEAGASLAHRRKIGKLDLVFGGYYFRERSVNDSSWTRRGRFNVNLRYRITDRFSIGLNTNFNRSKGASFFFWGGVDSLLYRPGAAISESNSSRYNVDPYLVYFDPANNRHKIQTRYFSVNNITGTAEADQSNISDVYYGEYQFQRKMEKTGLVATAGFVYTGTKVRAPLYGDTTFTSRNLAGYLQLDKKLFDRLNLSAGFRYENNLVLTPDTIHYKTDGFDFKGVVPGGEIAESKPVFRFGASYAIDPATFIRASWGQGYRFPTIAEKFIYTLFGNIPITPNFDLHSETGWTAEVGLRKGFQASNFNGFVDIATFLSDYNDMMEFTFIPSIPPSFQSRNVGDTRIKGFEASITGRGRFLGLETNMLIGYTYIDPKFKEFGLDLPEGSNGLTAARNSSVCSNPTQECHNILKYRYKHSAKLDIESTYKQWTIGVAALYNSFMENIDAAFESPFGVPGLYEFRQQHNKGDLIWNLRSAYKLTPGLKASLLLNNVFNREYVLRPGLLEPTRNLTLRLDLDF
jgi:iron complex outermembrane receptor protein